MTQKSAVFNEQKWINKEVKRVRLQQYEFSKKAYPIVKHRQICNRPEELTAGGEKDTADLRLCSVTW